MAVYLPIIGTVHRDSETGDLIRTLGLDSTGLCDGPTQIADCLLRLTDSGFWMEQSARSRNAFEYWQAKEPPAQRLRRTLDQAAVGRLNNPGDDKYREQIRNGAA
jgi:hypothetical protein